MTPWTLSSCSSSLLHGSSSTNLLSSFGLHFAQSLPTMAGHSIVDSSALSKQFNFRDNISTLTRMHVPDFRAAHSIVNPSSSAGHQSAADYVVGAGNQWRTACSVSSRQWVEQIEEPKPVVEMEEEEEEESIDLQATAREPPSENLLGALVPGAVDRLPRPLSVADLANPPTHGLSVRVAYQGVPGAYSETAALKAYPNCEAVPCEQFEAAFQAVELWLVDRAVLPIENSLGGSIHRNYDLLLRHRLHIVGEVQVPVNHCLLGLPGVRKEELRRILSHPQALSQCKGTLTKLGVIREEVDDTAGAAQFIAQHNLRDTGAVASARAAEIYGLSVLLEGIQVHLVQNQCLQSVLVAHISISKALVTRDDPDNITRFLMLAREPIIPRTDRPFKTSIVFTLEEGPGVLFKALGVFSLRNINLTKIESRPQRKKPLRVVDDSNNGEAKYFDYLFYIDFEASMADPRAQNALGHLQEFATFLRVLGSYPMDMTSLERRPSTS